MVAERTTGRAEQPRWPRGLGLAVLGPPVLWLVQFQVRYALADAVPGSRQHVVVVATGLVSLMITVVLVLLSLRYWRLADASPLDRFAGITGRMRFLGQLGVLLGSLFLLVTLAQLLADVSIKPGVR